MKNAIFLVLLLEKKAESMAQFMSCKTYENVAPVSNWEKMYQNEQFEIAKNVIMRLKQRNTYTTMLTPWLQDTVEQCKIFYRTLLE